MAIDYIKVTQSSPNTPGAGLLLQYIAAQRQAYDLGNRVLGIMNHNFQAPDFSNLETLFGLPTGKGQTVFDMVNGAVGSMTGVFQSSNAKLITEQVGG